MKVDYTACCRFRLTKLAGLFGLFVPLRPRVVLYGVVCTAAFWQLTLIGNFDAGTSFIVNSADILDKLTDTDTSQKAPTVAHTRQLAHRWWIGLGVILLGAGLLRFSGFTFGLPYFENIDEPWFFYEAAFQRGLISNWLHPNPSQGLMLLYKMAQIGAETLTGQSALLHAPDVIAVLRLVSVLISLFTLVFVGLCGRELAGNKAGWLAAALWAVIPLVAYHSTNAIAEPWMMLLAAIALYTAAVAVKRDQRRYALISVWAGLAAFAFKYSMFSFAGIGLAAALWSLWSQWPTPARCGYWLRTLLWQVLSVIIFLIAMVLFGGLAHDVSSPSREVAQFIQSPLARLTDPRVVAQVITSGFGQIGLGILLFLILIGAALIVIGRSSSRGSLRHNPDLAIWIGFGLLGTFAMLLVPLYLMTDATLLRYLFAADLIFVILAASSFIVLYDAIRPRLTKAIRATSLSLGALALIGIWLAPLVGQSISEAYERTLPYTLTDMTVWASSTLGAGGIITEGAGSRAFTHEMGGYTGPYRVSQYGLDLLSKSPQSWQQAGYQYVEIVPDADQSLTRSSEGRDYLAQLLELRRFPPPDSKGPRIWTGLPFIVYQLQRPVQSVSVDFGSTFRLIGVDGIKTRATVGDSLALRFYWQAPRTPTDNYSLFIHLTPATDPTKLIAQADGAPGPTSRPTLTWAVPSEVLVSDAFALTIPANIPPGVYNLTIGLYNPVSGQRLTTTIGNEWLLTTITVAPHRYF
jgi:hypothetical protein